MSSTDIIGFAAAILTPVSLLPQAIKSFKTKKTSDLSLPMYLILVTVCLLWLTYGIILKQAPIILANGIVLLISLFILTLKSKYG